jgi:hypothetical protein
MRVPLLVLGALALTVSAAGTADLDLHGTARAGDRPQPNAVPAGTFTYHAWRPGGPDLTGKVTIDAGQPLDIHWP